MTNKEILIAHIENGTVKPELVDFLVRLINEGMSKSVLMDFVYSEEERKKVDSAYPQEYANSIRDRHPNWQGWTHVYDYNRTAWGEMVDVGAKALQKINELVK